MRSFSEFQISNWIRPDINVSATTKVISGQNFVEITGTTSDVAPGDNIRLEMYHGASFFQELVPVRDDGTFFARINVPSRRIFVVIVQTLNGVIYDVYLG